jgi:protein arginine kinase activator
MSMLCDVCQKNEATVFFKGTFNKKTFKLNLCEECAKEKGLEIKPPFKISNLFSTLADFGLSLPVVKEKKILRCQKCGLDIVEFKEEGKLGCAQCYETFSDYLETIFEKMYGSIKHKGKTLLKVPTKAEPSIEEKIQELKRQLQETLKKEEYEKAAELRDKIKELESKK